jgi:acetyl-CoA decarbonylase/synthase complex subunit gamma
MDKQVFVTANYKMSFDSLRSALAGRDAWILVLDTAGINVWCAAGKGSFGTMELARRIESSQLKKLVRLRELILPQLAGPGVAAHLVKKLSNFKVTFGPIQAEDLPDYLKTGLKATSRMRQKSFTLLERLVLIPVELVSALKWGAVLSIAMIVLQGLLAPLGFWANIIDHGPITVFAMLGAILAGAVATPLLLPWLPGRALSVKGLIPGLLAAFFLGIWTWGGVTSRAAYLEVAAWFLMIPAVTAYLAMNFTGATTYTSLSGVRKEMRWALPMEIGVCIMGLGLWVTSLWTV